MTPPPHFRMTQNNQGRLFIVTKDMCVRRVVTPNITPLYVCGVEGQLVPIGVGVPATYTHTHTHTYTLTHIHTLAHTHTHTCTHTHSHTHAHTHRHAGFLY